jgi:hypothetical protein
MRILLGWGHDIERDCNLCAILRAIGGGNGCYQGYGVRTTRGEPSARDAKRNSVATLLVQRALTLPQMQPARRIIALCDLYVPIPGIPTIIDLNLWFYLIL